MSAGSRPSGGGSPSRRTGPAETRPTLEEILGAIQREEASASFTARVLARRTRVLARRTRVLARRAPSRRLLPLPARSWRSPLAIAGALAVACLAGFLLGPRFEPAGRPPLETPAALAQRADLPAGEAEALRVRLRDLERELFELERLAAERQPLIAVEGDHADYLIDLRDFLPTTRSEGAVPARYGGEGGPRNR
jgi:hypothetical protein